MLGNGRQNYSIPANMIHQTSIRHWIPVTVGIECILSFLYEYISRQRCFDLMLPTGDSHLERNERVYRTGIPRSSGMHNWCCTTPAGHKSGQTQAPRPSSGVLSVLQCVVREHPSGNVPKRLCPATSQIGVFDDANKATMWYLSLKVFATFCRKGIHRTL